MQSVRPDSARQWGKMNAHQMVCHLNDSFLTVMGERPSTRHHPQKLIKWGALWVPIQWPHGFQTMPELDQQIGGTRPEEFRNDVQKLLSLFDRFTAEPPPAFVPHPVFGEMSRREWMRWGYLHTDHHLRQFGC